MDARLRHCTKIGIDESNNGQPWEVHVAVYSYNGTKFKAGWYDKLKTDTTIPRILGGDMYQHIVVPRKELMEGEYGVPSNGRPVTQHDIRAMVYCEFFGVSGNLEKAIIDGNPSNDKVNTKIIRRIENFFHGLHGRFRFPRETYMEPRAETNYLIANKADAVARHLYRYYRDVCDPHDCCNFENTRLKPKWAEYIEVMHN